MFNCSQCSHIFQKWQGRCNNCNSWNSLVESQDQKNSKSASQRLTVSGSKPIQAKDIPQKSIARLKSSLNEWDSVLGGGIVPGSFLILTGDPGVGKSTMMIQIANLISSQKHKVIYFSSEESLSQLYNKLKNFNLLKTETLFCEEHSVEKILATLKEEKPILAIIDSLQNCRLTERYTQNFNAISAIKETAHEIMLVAKEHNIAIIMTGHITKDGSLAGPKLLEHLVDGVFYLQNDQECQRKFLCSIKNRFGPVDEVGFFQMNDTGLVEIKDVNQEILLENLQRNNLGSCLFLAFKGSRCLISEFQTLCLKNKTNIPQRVISGVDQKKVLIIAALLEKYLKLDTSTLDIFFKIKGGLKINETYSDLCIALTIISSIANKSLPEKCIAIGEINLNGYITPPHNLDQVVKQCKKLGITKIFTGKIKKPIEEFGDLVHELEHIYHLSTLFKN